MADEENTNATRLFISEQLQKLVDSGQLTPFDQEIVGEPTADSPEKLKRAVGVLTPDERELLVLFQVMSCKQIAELKQQPVSSIRKTVSDLYTSLRSEINFT